MNKDNTIPNLYELEGMSTFKKKVINPHYDKHKIHLPFKAFCVGGSGISRKTSGVIWFITQLFQDTFDKIIICVKNSEPLWEWFMSLLPPGSYDFYEDEIPDMKTYQKNSEYDDKQLLFIFDDFMNTPDANKKILEYFIRGRKIGANSSMINIVQSFTGLGSVGKSLRANVSLWMIKRVNSTSVIEELAHQFKFGKTKDEIVAMYNYCNSESPNNMFLINIEAENPSEIFRKNLYEFLE